MVHWELQKAEKLIDKGRYDKGEEICKRYSEQDISEQSKGNVAFANYLLAQSVLRRNKEDRDLGFSEGLRYYTRSIRAEPTSDAYFGRGGLLRFRAHGMAWEERRVQQSGKPQINRIKQIKISKLYEKAEKDLIQTAILASTPERRGIITTELQRQVFGLGDYHRKISEVA